MKKILFGGALLLSSLGFAQFEGTGFVSVIVGNSNPTGEFARSELYEENAHFAQEGTTFGINGGYMLNKNFGLAGRFSMSSWDTEIPNVTNASPRFITTSFLAGGMFSIPTGRFAFDFRLLAGMASTTYEKHRFDSSTTWGNGTSTTTIYVPESNMSEIAYSYGTSARFHASDKIDLMANVDFFNTKPRSDYYISSKNISTTDFTVGVGLRL